MDRRVGLVSEKHGECHDVLTSFYFQTSARARSREAPTTSVMCREHLPTHRGARARGLRGGGAAAGGDALRNSGNTPVVGEEEKNARTEEGASKTQQSQSRLFCE